jgi:hypothetical protein
LKKLIWPVIGISTVMFSVWLLVRELRGVSLDELTLSIAEVSAKHWLLSGICTVAAYAALAAYDRVALLHLGRRLSPLFIAVTSFTAYALSHTVGASVLSGAVVRYRAYTSRGLTGAEVGVLVAFCSFTFVLGTVMLIGLVLVIEPHITERFVDILPVGASTTTGLALLALVGLYVLGSWREFPPLRIRSFEFHYPRLPVVALQLLVAPTELLAAAAIVYFALPAAGNPGYIVVLGIFLVSFSVALLSHAPGGIGILELTFVTGLPDMDPADVIAALLVFRLLYLIIPFLAALVVILAFERSQLGTE